MEVVIVQSQAEGSALAADVVAHVVRDKPRAVVGLATGSTPEGTYRELARRVAAGRLDFSEARGFALDEYVGIAPDHPQSYASVLRREVAGPLRMDPARVRVPDGRARDIPAACSAYERAIRQAGGVDVQILGIGANGHIGFNEPTSSLASRTREKTLTPRTRADNARFFASPADVPTHCLTQGLATIREARRLLLLAFGARKAAAIAAAVEGPVSSFCPASVLQLHPRATVIVDEQAAAKLALAGYYRYAYAHKPAWQRA